MHKGFVLLNCDLGAEEYILDELKQVAQIKNAYVTFGAYDIIAEVHAQTQEEFEEFIVKSGAKGSFMVYRTDKKDEELGIDEL